MPNQLENQMELSCFYFFFFSGKREIKATERTWRENIKFGIQ